MRERMKLERSFIIKASHGTTSLRQVYENIKKQRRDAKRGFDESVWTNLQAYFEKVLPQLENTPMTKDLLLSPGVNVMDLGHLSEEVQGLVIAACLEEIWKTGRDTVVVVPEAWKFIPQARGNPVKWAAQHVIREGGASGIFLVLDSQDVTNIDKAVLKSVDTWLLGRQREINEVRRVLAQIAVTPKPTPQQVMTLGVGHFYVASGDWCKLVYVQPRWMDEAVARAVAMGSRLPPPAPAPAIVLTEEEDDMDIEKMRALEQERDGLRKLASGQELLIKEVQGQLAKAKETLQGLRGELATLEPMRALATALRAVLGSPAASAAHAGDPPKEWLERAAQSVMARIPAGRPIVQVAPQKALAHKFQEQTSERLLAAIRALTPLQRTTLEWLIGVNKTVRYREICLGLGRRTDGQDYIIFTKGIKQMIALGLIREPEGHGLAAGVREKVSQDMAPYGASDDDVEATYQAVMTALLGAGQ